MKTVTYPVGMESSTLVQRAFLVGVQGPGGSKEQTEEMLDE